MNRTDVTPGTPGPWRVALAGGVSLAVAMGIGRFAFTPLLPLMLRDGLIDLVYSSWLASANYLGYLAGALLCTAQPWLWNHVPGLPRLSGTRIIKGGLAATVLLTLAMAAPVPALWPALRFAAGVASAFVFVYTSGWCLSHLALRRASNLGGAMYAGPGAGILISGLFASALVQWHGAATLGWVVFGGLALGLSAMVWSTLGTAAAPAPATNGTAAAPLPATVTVTVTAASPAEMAIAAMAYGLAGFGYIVTATFLPVIARISMPGSSWLVLFWPIFGLGVGAGALLSTWLRVSGDLRWLLTGAYLIQAGGIGVSLLSPDLPGFALGSLMLGIPFTAITFFVMQEVRRLRPGHTASYMGLFTSMYGVGQIVGPPLVALLLRRSAAPAEGFERSLQTALSALLLGAAMFAWSARAYPMRRG